MSSLFGKIRDIVGLPGTDEYDDDFTYDDDELVDEVYDDEYEEDIVSPLVSEQESYEPVSEPEVAPKMGNVVGMPNASRFWSGSASEVLVMEPKTFEEMPQVIQSLRDRKSVVLNLTMMDAAQAQRAVDFVAGATFTIDGHQERVGESIFLFTPNCVQVRTQTPAPQPAAEPQQPSRVATQSWQDDPVMNQIAQ